MAEPVARMSWQEVRSYVAERARESGLSLEELLKTGAEDRLEDPALRDLYLIWGKALEQHEASLVS